MRARGAQARQVALEGHDGLLHLLLAIVHDRGHQVLLPHDGADRVDP